MALLVQSAFHSNGAAATTVAATLANAVTAGNTVIVWVLGAFNATPTITVTDDKSNTGTLVDRTFNSTANYTMAGYYLSNVTNGPITYTATFNSSQSGLAIIVEEWFGLGTLNGHGAASQTSVGSGANAVTTGNFTTTVDGCRIIACGVNIASTGIAPGSNYFASSQRNSGGNSFTTEAQVQAAHSSTTTATMTNGATGVNNVIQAMAFTVTSTTVYITSGTSGNFPADFSSTNFIDAIGGGGGGGNSTNSQGGPGGGGAEWRRLQNATFAAGSSYFCHIGAGGAGNGNGTSTWLNTVSNAQPTLTSQGVAALFGHQPTGGVNGGVGGSGGVGNFGNNGGAGANCASGRLGGSGGGGAGGPFGVGALGGACNNTGPAAGSGGGAANGGTVGAANSTTTVGAGGFGLDGGGNGGGGGPSGVAGVAGVAGGTYYTSAAVAAGPGGGGGGGGTNGTTTQAGGGVGGAYGGGGGGSSGSAGGTNVGGTGGAGVIILDYIPVTSDTFANYQAVLMM